MCFSNDYDYDWIVQDSNESDATSDGGKSFRCYDCQNLIPAGDKCLFTEQWEFECCPDCGFRHMDDCECLDDGERITKDHGESQVMHQCLACLDFRKAIKALEISEGCGEHEATPNDSLHEEFGNMGEGDRVREYVEHACTMFPARAQEFLEEWSHFWEDASN